MKPNGYIYIFAAIIVMVAIWLTVRFDDLYGPLLTTIGIGAIILLLIVGQFIVIREKRQANESISRHVGLIIGLIALFLFRVLF